jgi:MinD-like ATPase involved in chromosome partitioning or flagellar assembly
MDEITRSIFHSTQAPVQVVSVTSGIGGAGKTNITSQFLDVMRDYIGMIPNDGYLRKAVQRCWPVVYAFPRSPSANAFTKLAANIDCWPIASTSGGCLEFFFEYLTGADARSVS